MKNQQKTRETIIRHLKSPPNEPSRFTIGQVMYYGLELSRNADGTIDLQIITENCHKALQLWNEIQEKFPEILERYNANLPTE